MTESLPATNKDAVLKLQIGPVQDFIAQARSTRDLWSGSYLLSWLVAVGLSRLVVECGNDRDAVIYPNLQGQPLVDFHLGGRNAAPDGDHTGVLTPNLPNIFVAKVPADRATALAKAVDHAIRLEWAAIARLCWNYACGVLGLAGKEGRYNAQVERFLHIAWQVMPIATGATGTSGASNYAEAYRQVSWLLDGVRQNRAFSSWRAGGWDARAEENKDSLSGKEELVIGGTAWWARHIKPISEDAGADLRWRTLFRERRSGERYGAITLVKRVWHWACLCEEHGLHSMHRSVEAERGKAMWPFPSTFHIARHDPAKNEEDPKERVPEDEPDRLGGYFAVLAFDGDRIGQWVSGDFAPPGADRERWHRDFSRHLTVFALNCVRRIVNACDGRLIYAGGDDVLALLPADTALECARFLRDAYRGDPGFLAELQGLAARLCKAHLEKGWKPPGSGSVEQDSPFLEAAAQGRLFSAENGRLGLHGDPSPLEVPGRLEGATENGQSIRPDASVGIAIGHFKHPLQDAIKAAQSAEKRAKDKYGRSAVAVTLLKRSGEQVTWGCQWQSGGIAAYRSMHTGMVEDAFSNRLPYRIAGVLTPQSIPDGSLAKGAFQVPAGFPWDQLICREADYILRRQRGKHWTSDRADGCLEAIRAYVANIPEGQKLAGIIGLCQAAAFTLPVRREGPETPASFTA